MLTNYLCLFFFTGRNDQGRTGSTSPLLYRDSRRHHRVLRLIQGSVDHTEGWIKVHLQDPKVNTDKLLCLAVLCIWNWSLLQFTIIVPAAKVILLFEFIKQNHSHSE